MVDQLASKPLIKNDFIVGIEMKKMVLLVPLCILVTITLNSQAQEAVPIAAFQEAKVLKQVAPRYPSGGVSHSEEGWVIVNFMVDQDGQTFEPAVIDSMGGARFERASLKALKKTKYAPAHASGDPVTSSKTMRYTFVIQGREKGARSNFVSKYSKFLKAINADDRDRAEDILAKMEEEGAKSLYEDAYLNLAKYYYAAKYADSLAQMKFLRGALYFADSNLKCII